MMIIAWCSPLFSQQKLSPPKQTPPPSTITPQPLPQPAVMEPPRITSFRISRGGAVTRSRDVSLDNTAERASLYRASERSDFYGAQWMPYSTSPRFILSPGDGPKTVYFQVKNPLGQISTVVSDSITLTMRPIISSFTISNWGVIYNWQTGESKITISTTNTCQNNPTQNRISEKSDLSDANWFTYRATPGININKGIGPRKIFYQTKNNYGVSNIVSAAIDVPARKNWTISAGDYGSFAKSKGFYFGAKAGDVTSQCKQPDTGGASIDLECGGGVTGSRCDYTLFGNRTLNEGWKFKNYESNAIARPGEGGYSVNQRPALDSRNIQFKVHLWSNPLKKVRWWLRTLTLEGPGDASPHEAFK